MMKTNRTALIVAMASEAAPDSGIVPETANWFLSEKYAF